MNNVNQAPLKTPFKEIILNTILAGVVLLIASVGALRLGVKIFPQFFVDYLNPIFNSDGTRDVYYYMHPFVLSFALAILWSRFKRILRGNNMMQGLEFGLLYGITALVPVMWITFSAMDVSLKMVITWLLYGLFQAVIAGLVFALIGLRKNS